MITPIWYVVIGTDDLGKYDERLWRAYTFARSSDAHRVKADLNSMDPKPGVKYYVVEWPSVESPGPVSEPGYAVND